MAQAVAQGNFKRVIAPGIRGELAALQVRDNWRNLGYLAGDWLWVVAAIVVARASSMHPLVYVLAVIAIGSRQRALLNLVHQGSHKKLFKHAALNDWLCKLFAAFPILTSLSGYACAHCIHHGFLWNAAKDPKTQRYAQLGLVRPQDDRAQFVRKHILKPLLLTQLSYYLAGAFSRSGEDQAETYQRIGFWVVALAALWLAGLGPGFVLFWVVPYCTSFQVIRYWADMTDHAGLQSDDLWLATRCWDGPLLMRWLLAPHSDHYHLAHHLFPLIPHYHLGRAHRLLMQVPQYAQAHHCDGFFWPRRADAPSVLQDIRRPQDIVRFNQIKGRRDASPAEQTSSGRL